ncbi:MAG: ABC transporter permease subunit [Spirochaetaceae bacterium]|nr:MAG: ABC transporter permease subunit [Spirochaetaceae bacterium]
MMNNILPIIKKELKSYFNSPIAYILVVTFLVFSSIWIFYLQTFFASNVASLRGFFSVIPIVFIIVMPALTMRSWAEEKKLGTMEVLMTLPFRESTLVIGKFLAAISLLVIMILLTLPLPLLLGRFGDFDWGEILGQYIGVVLLGAAGISVGLFVSSLMANQISSFLISLFVLLVLTLISQVNRVFPLPPWAAGMVNFVSLGHHFSNFQRGLIDTRDLLYYGIVSALFLYLNTKTLVFRKW